MNKPSLRSRIKDAKTTDELTLLEAEGASFEHASVRTRRQWDRAINDRTAQLGNK